MCVDRICVLSNIDCNIGDGEYLKYCSVFSYTDDSLSNDNYSDLETPVSTLNYFRSIQNLGEIQNTLGNDSGPCVCLL